jgi:NAD(P)-dependent dehydrogenase (short-subunit alcohol dehydrogenase family)
MRIMSYANTIAIVTGGASGIGLGLVRGLAAAGARVILADRSLEAATAAAAAIGPAVEPMAVDVTDPAAVQAMVDETLRRHGRIDYLFNNAGIGHAGEVRDLALADWARVMDVNFWGVVHGVTAVYPQMLQQGHGHIVNISSGAGLGPRPGMVPYAASKHAVVGLSTSLRAEAKGLGVKVSVVCPGSIATNMLKTATFQNLDGAALLAKVPAIFISGDECGRRILKGVARNRAIIPVTAVAWLEWLVFRYVPVLGWLIADFRGRQFRAHRVEP